MLFSNRSLDYTFKVKLLTAVMVFVVVVVGNDVFKRYYHGKFVFLLLFVYIHLYIHKTMFAISPDSVDLNYERSRKSVLTWKQKQGLFSFF